MSTPDTQPIGMKASVLEAARTKSGIAGFAMLGLLLGVSLAVPFYSSEEVTQVWSDTTKWLDNPRTASPTWVEIFQGKSLPRTIIIEPSSAGSGPGYFKKAAVPSQISDLTFISLNREFQYDYDDFPSELSLSVLATYGANGSRVTVTFVRPNPGSTEGDRVLLFQAVPRRLAPNPNFYPLSSINYERDFESTLQANLRLWLASKGVQVPVDPSTNDYIPLRPEIVLYSQIAPDMLERGKAQVLKGEYKIELEMIGFRRIDDMDARFISYGTVFGIAGTDGKRRDLLVGLLWGAPVALAFGTAAAFVVVIIQTILGALSGWYGGASDELVQRGSDFLLILPLLPLLVILSLFLNPGLWIILGVVALLGILGSTSKVVRSLVIQIKEEQFIEAARSYGASKGRILIRYLLPRVMPYTFALIALNVPAYIFLEASLDFLGLGDPRVPTWGGILGEAYEEGALYSNIWWWVALPTAGILFAAVAFSLLGYSFDKVLNTRLREE